MYHTFSENIWSFCKYIFFPLFQLYQDQVQLLLDAFKNPPQTREEGIYFDDRQYKCVRADKTSIYGKCVSWECNENLGNPVTGQIDMNLIVLTGPLNSNPTQQMCLWE